MKHMWDRSHRRANHQHPNWRVAWRSCALIEERRAGPGGPAGNGRGLFMIVSLPSNAITDGEYGR